MRPNAVTSETCVAGTTILAPSLASLSWSVATSVDTRETLIVSSGLWEFS